LSASIYLDLQHERYGDAGNEFVTVLRYCNEKDLLCDYGEYTAGGLPARKRQISGERAKLPFFLVASMADEESITAMGHNAVEAEHIVRWKMEQQSIEHVPDVCKLADEEERAGQKLWDAKVKTAAHGKALLTAPLL
jgi:hypothetical protein